MVTRYRPFIARRGQSPSGWRQPCGCSRSQGFTLVELMIVLLILAIMLGMAAPAFRDLVRAQRVKTASFDVFSSLVLLRSEAITRGWTLTLRPPADGNWANGWTVECVDPEPNPELNRCRRGETNPTIPLVIRSQGALPNVIISAPAISRLCFDGVGRPTSTNPSGQACSVPSGAGIGFSITATDVSAANSRCITMDIGGRPVSKTGPCS